MNYININKKRLVGRNNQPNIQSIVLDFDTIQTIEFQFINDLNQIQNIGELSGLYFAGSIKMSQPASGLLFLSQQYSIEDKTIKFNVDTYTTNYLREIKKKNTNINIEIGQIDGENKKVMLRDTGLACPRVYVEGLSPSQIENNYYTKNEVDQLIDSIEIPSATSQLVNDSGFITGYTQTDPIFSAMSGDFELKSQAFDGDYNSLSNKPDIPSATSQLINDSGFITGYTQDDPVFTAMSGDFELKSQAFNGDYNSLTNKPDIPSATSQLVNDSGFITGYTQTDPIFSAMSGDFELKQDAFNGDYNSLTNKPDIPSATSQLVNDSGFITGYVQTDPIFSAMSGDFAKKVNYQTITNTTFTAETKKYYKTSSAISTLNLTIPNGLSDCVILFETASNFTYSITVANNVYINKDFDFQPDSAYVLAVDNNCVLWSKVIEFPAV